jgi:predicted  nucleic acid-binding Zn-ribbon protein
MKRVLFAVSAFALSFGLVGCGSDSHEGLITNTITMMDNATAEIKNIRNSVETATKEAIAQNKATVDLTKAIKASENLKKVSEEAMNLKRRIEQERSKITDEEKKQYADKQKEQLNTAFTDLLKAKVALRKQLADTEGLSANAKVEVEKLREKIREAESPFESIAR